MSGADQIRAVLNAYRQLADAWQNLPRVKPERAAQWATADESTLRAALAEYMHATGAQGSAARVFWKLGDGLAFGGCNALFATDAGLGADELVGLTDIDPRIPWRAQGAKYRADDKAVMASGKANLDIIERQTTPEGNTIWCRAGKVPLRLPTGEVIGLFGAYDVVDEATGKRLLVESLRKSKATS